MNHNVTIRNIYKCDVIVEVGKYYYVESQDRRYGSGTIYIDEISSNPDRIYFDLITASMPEGVGVDSSSSYTRRKCDVGSVYAAWIIREENNDDLVEIKLSYDSLINETGENA